MRKIKYRQHLKPAYRAKGDIFHYWGFIDGGFVSPVGKNVSIHKGDQYTGLKDKDGVEIYEGDIVEIEFEDGETSPMEVIYRAPRFFLCHEGFWSLGSKDVSYSVIGNIHENPELLEVVK